MIDRRDPNRAYAALTPTDLHPPDNSIHCYRPSGALYAVLSRSEWKRLREQGKLDAYLDKQRR